MNMVFTTQGLFEVARESLPDWGLNPQPLNSFRRFIRLRYQAMSSNRSQSEHPTATPVSPVV